MTDAPYQLDALGWLQFDRLCPLVLESETGLTDLRWRGRPNAGPVALVDHDVALRDRGRRLRGPVAVAAIWVRDAPTLERRLEQFKDHVVAARADAGVRDADALLVLTNLDGDAARAALSWDTGTREQRGVVLGAEEISTSFDRDPGLRAAMPSVLGLRDLDALIDPEVRRGSSLDVERAQELARVFWPTRAYERARNVLDRHRFVVLTGPPEMGKTAIAEMLALAHLTDGWEAHQCSDPDQVAAVSASAGAPCPVADACACVGGFDRSVYNYAYTVEHQTAREVAASEAHVDPDRAEALFGLPLGSIARRYGK